ncbi:hypothetical protein MKX01_021863 [Papaver californicum]|nr:hypothetical protein MKX01_021863 [Papaver californicum]
MWMVKERKVKKVKEMDQNPSLCLENVILAEKSFAVEQHEASVSNGYHLEWTDKVQTKTSPTSQESVHKFGETSPARCRRVYNHAHDCNLNSISTGKSSVPINYTYSLQIKFKLLPAGFSVDKLKYQTRFPFEVHIVATKIYCHLIRSNSRIVQNSK